jgi:CheY-like chemotaxis protein
LSIVKRICKLIDSEISINSQVDKGTTFTLSTRYPVSSAVDPIEVKNHHIPSPYAKGISIFGRTIAVIEDDPVVLQAYVQALTTRGAIVVKIALDHKEFENQMATLDASTIDFIISDYRLKTSSGAEMINKLREAFNDEIPALIVTADTSPSHIQYFTNLNIPVLHKPVSFEQVISVVESRLNTIHPAATPVT